MSHKNNLELKDISQYPELNLTEVENSLIARHLIFQRAMDEANLKVKGAQEKQNERDQKRATDEAN